MKKTLLIAIASLALFSCKKESKEETTTTTYYIKVVEVDADNQSVTETPIASVKITE